MDGSVGSAEGWDVGSAQDGSVPGAMQLVRGNMEAFETNSASTVGTSKGGHNPFVSQPDARERLAQIHRGLAQQELLRRLGNSGNPTNNNNLQQQMSNSNNQQQYTMGTSLNSSASPSNEYPQLSSAGSLGGFPAHRSGEASNSLGVLSSGPYGGGSVGSHMPVFTHFNQSTHSFGHQQQQQHGTNNNSSHHPEPTSTYRGGGGGSSTSGNAGMLTAFTPHNEGSSHLLQTTPPGVSPQQPRSILKPMSMTSSGQGANVIGLVPQGNTPEIQHNHHHHNHQHRGPHSSSAHMPPVGITFLPSEQGGSQNSRLGNTFPRSVSFSDGSEDPMSRPRPSPSDGSASSSSPSNSPYHSAGYHNNIMPPPEETLRMIQALPPKVQDRIVTFMELLYPKDPNATPAPNTQQQLAQQVINNQITTYLQQQQQQAYLAQQQLAAAAYQQQQQHAFNNMNISQNGQGGGMQQTQQQLEAITRQMGSHYTLQQQQQMMNYYQQQQQHLQHQNGGYNNQFGGNNNNGSSNTNQMKGNEFLPNMFPMGQNLPFSPGAGFPSHPPHYQHQQLPPQPGIMPSSSGALTSDVSTGVFSQASGAYSDQSSSMAPFLRANTDEGFLSRNHSATTFEGGGATLPEVSASVGGLTAGPSGGSARAGGTPLANSISLDNGNNSNNGGGGGPGQMLRLEVFKTGGLGSGTGSLARKMNDSSSFGAPPSVATTNIGSKMDTMFSSIPPRSRVDSSVGPAFDNGGNGANPTFSPTAPEKHNLSRATWKALSLVSGLVTTWSVSQSLHTPPPPQRQLLSPSGKPKTDQVIIDVPTVLQSPASILTSSVAADLTSDVLSARKGAFAALESVLVYSSRHFFHRSSHNAHIRHFRPIIIVSALDGQLLRTQPPSFWPLAMRGTREHSAMQAVHHLYSLPQQGSSASSSSSAGQLSSEMQLITMASCPSHYLPIPLLIHVDADELGRIALANSRSRSKSNADRKAPASPDAPTNSFERTAISSSLTGNTGGGSGGWFCFRGGDDSQNLSVQASAQHDANRWDTKLISKYIRVSLPRNYHLIMQTAQPDSADSNKKISAALVAPEKGKGAVDGFKANSPALNNNNSKAAGGSGAIKGASLLSAERNAANAPVFVDTLYLPSDQVRALRNQTLAMGLANTKANVIQVLTEIQRRHASATLTQSTSLRQPSSSSASVGGVDGIQQWELTPLLGSWLGRLLAASLIHNVHSSVRAACICASLTAKAAISGSSAQAATTNHRRSKQADKLRSHGHAVVEVGSVSEEEDMDSLSGAESSTGGDANDSKHRGGGGDTNTTTTRVTRISAHPTVSKVISEETKSKILYETKVTASSMYFSRRVLLSMAVSSVPFLQRQELARLIKLAIRSFVADYRDLIVATMTAIDFPGASEPLRPVLSSQVALKGAPLSVESGGRNKSIGGSPSAAAGKKSKSNNTAPMNSEDTADTEAAKELLITIASLTNMWCADIIENIFIMSESIAAPLRVVENILAVQLAHVHESTFQEYAKGPSPLMEASTFSLHDLMPPRDNPLASEDTDDEAASVNLAASTKNGGTSSSVLMNSTMALGSTVGGQGSFSINLPHLLHLGGISGHQVESINSSSMAHLGSNARLATSVSHNVSVANSLGSATAFAEYFCKSAQNATVSASPSTVQGEAHTYPAFAGSAGFEDMHLLSLVAYPHTRLAHLNSRKASRRPTAGTSGSTHSSSVSSGSRTTVTTTMPISSSGGEGGGPTTPSNANPPLPRHTLASIQQQQVSASHATYIFDSISAASASLGNFLPVRVGVTSSKVSTFPITSASLLPTPHSFMNPIHRLLLPDEVRQERIRRQHLGELLWKLKSDTFLSALRTTASSADQRRIRKLCGSSLSRSDIQIVNALGVRLIASSSSSKLEGGNKSIVSASPHLLRITARDVLEALQGATHVYSDGRTASMASTILSLPPLAGKPNKQQQGTGTTPVDPLESRSALVRFSKSLRPAIAYGGAAKDKNNDSHPRPGEGGTATVLMINDFGICESLVSPPPTAALSTSQDSPDGTTNKNNGKTKRSKKSGATKKSSRSKTQPSSSPLASPAAAALHPTIPAHNAAVRSKIIATTIGIQDRGNSSKSITGQSTIPYFVMSSFLHNTASQRSMQSGFPFFSSVELYPLSLRCVAVSTVEAAARIAKNIGPDGAMQLAKDSPTLFVSALQQLHFFVSQVAELLRDGTNNAAQIYLLEKQLLAVSTQVERAEIRVRRLQDDFFVCEIRHRKIAADFKIAHPPIKSPTEEKKPPKKLPQPTNVVPDDVPKATIEEYESAMGELSVQATKLAAALDAQISTHQELLEEQSALRYQLDVFMKPGGQEELRKTRLSQLLFHINMFLDVFVFQGCLLGGGSRVAECGSEDLDMEGATDDLHSSTSTSNKPSNSTTKRAAKTAAKLFGYFWKQSASDWESSLVEEYDSYGGSLRVNESGEGNSASSENRSSNEKQSVVLNAQQWLISTMRHVLRGGSHPGFSRSPASSSPAATATIYSSSGNNASIMSGATNKTDVGSSATRSKNKLPFMSPAGPSSSSLRQRKPKKKTVSSVKFPSEESGESTAARGGNNANNAAGVGNAGGVSSATGGGVGGDFASRNQQDVARTATSHHPIYLEELRNMEEGGTACESTYRQYLRGSSGKAIGGSTITILSGVAMRTLLLEEKRRTRALLGKKPHINASHKFTGGSSSPAIGVAGNGTSTNNINNTKAPGSPGRDIDTVSNSKRPHRTNRSNAKDSSAKLSPALKGAESDRRKQSKADTNNSNSQRKSDDVTTDVEELKLISSVTAGGVVGGGGLGDLHMQSMMEDAPAGMLKGGMHTFGQSVGGWMAPGSQGVPDRPMTSANAPRPSNKEEVIEMEVFPSNTRRSPISRKHKGGGGGGDNPLLPPSSSSRGKNNSNTSNLVADRLRSDDGSSAFSDPERRQSSGVRKVLKSKSKQQQREKRHGGDKSRRKSQKKSGDGGEQRSSSASSWASEASSRASSQAATNTTASPSNRKSHTRTNNGCATLFPDAIESIFPAENPLDIAIAARERFKRRRRLLLHLVAVESARCIGYVPIPEEHVAAREAAMSQGISATTTVENKFLGGASTSASVYHLIRATGNSIAGGPSRYHQTLEGNCGQQGGASTMNHSTNNTTLSTFGGAPPAAGGIDDTREDSNADSSTLLDKSAPSSSERRSKRSRRSGARTTSQKRKTGKSQQAGSDSDTSAVDEVTEKEKRREKKREKKRIERVRAILKDELRRQEEQLHLLRKNLVVFAELWADLDLSSDTRLLIDAPPPPKPSPTGALRAPSSPAGLSTSDPVDSVIKLQRMQRDADEDEAVTEQHRGYSPDNFGKAPPTTVESAQGSTISPGGSFSTAKPSFISTTSHSVLGGSVRGGFLGDVANPVSAPNTARLDHLIDRIFNSGGNSTTSDALRELHFHKLQQQNQDISNNNSNNGGGSSGHGASSRRRRQSSMQATMHQPSKPPTIGGAAGELLKYREGIKACMGCGGVYKECRADEGVTQLINGLLESAPLLHANPSRQRAASRTNLANSFSMNSTSVTNPEIEPPGIHVSQGGANSISSTGSTKNPSVSLGSAVPMTSTGSFGGREAGSSDDSDDDWASPSAPPTDRKAPFPLPVQSPNAPFTSKTAPPKITSSPLMAAGTSTSSNPFQSEISDEAKTLQKYRTRLLGHTNSGSTSRMVENSTIAKQSEHASKVVDKYCPQCSALILHGRSNVVAALAAQLTAEDTSMRGSKKVKKAEPFIESDLPLTSQLDNVCGPMGLDIPNNTNDSHHRGVNGLTESPANLQSTTGAFGRQIKQKSLNSLASAPKTRLTIFASIVASDSLAVLEQASGQVSTISTAYGAYIFVDRERVETALNKDTMNATINVTNPDRCVWDIPKRINANGAEANNPHPSSISPRRAENGGGAVGVPTLALERSSSNSTGGTGSTHEEGTSYGSWSGGQRDSPVSPHPDTVSTSAQDLMTSLGESPSLSLQGSPVSPSSPSSHMQGGNNGDAAMAEAGITQHTIKMSKKALGGGSSLYGGVLGTSWMANTSLSTSDNTATTTIPIAQTALVVLMFAITVGALVGTGALTDINNMTSIIISGVAIAVSLVCTVAVVLLSFAAATAQKRSRAWVVKLRHVLTRTSVAVDSLFYRGPGALVSDLYAARAELTAFRLEAESARKSQSQQIQNALLQPSQTPPARGQELPMFKLFQEGGSILQTTAAYDSTGQRRREQELELQVFQLRRMLQCMAEGQQIGQKRASRDDALQADPSLSNNYLPDSPSSSALNQRSASSEMMENLALNHEALLSSKLLRLLPHSSNMLRPGAFASNSCTASILPTAPRGSCVGPQQTSAVLCDDELLYGYCFSEDMALKALRTQLLGSHHSNTIDPMASSSVQDHHQSALQLRGAAPYQRSHPSTSSTLLKSALMAMKPQLVAASLNAAPSNSSTNSLGMSKLVQILRELDLQDIDTARNYAAERHNQQGAMYNNDDNHVPNAVSSMNNNSTNHESLQRLYASLGDLEASGSETFMIALRELLSSTSALPDALREQALYRLQAAASSQISSPNIPTPTTPPVHTPPFRSPVGTAPPASSPNIDSKSNTTSPKTGASAGPPLPAVKPVSVNEWDSDDNSAETTPVSKNTPSFSPPPPAAKNSVTSISTQTDPQEVKMVEFHGIKDSNLNLESNKATEELSQTNRPVHASYPSLKSSQTSGGSGGNGEKDLSGSLGKANMTDSISPSNSAQSSSTSTAATTPTTTAAITSSPVKRVYPSSSSSAVARIKGKSLQRAVTDEEDELTREYADLAREEDDDYLSDASGNDVGLKFSAKANVTRRRTSGPMTQDQPHNNSSLDPSAPTAEGGASVVSSIFGGSHSPGIGVPISSSSSSGGNTTTTTGTSAADAHAATHDLLSNIAGTFAEEESSSPNMGDLMLYSTSPQEQNKERPPAVSARSSMSSATSSKGSFRPYNPSNVSTSRRVVASTAPTQHNNAKSSSPKTTIDLSGNSPVLDRSSSPTSMIPHGAQNLSLVAPQLLRMLSQQHQQKPGDSLASNHQAMYDSFAGAPTTDALMDAYITPMKGADVMSIALSPSNSTSAMKSRPSFPQRPSITNSSYNRPPGLPLGGGHEKRTNASKSSSSESSSPIVGLMKLFQQLLAHQIIMTRTQLASLYSVSVAQQTQSQTTSVANPEDITTSTSLGYIPDDLLKDIQELIDGKDGADNSNYDQQIQGGDSGGNPTLASAAGANISSSSSGGTSTLARAAAILQAVAGLPNMTPFISLTSPDMPLLQEHFPSVVSAADVFLHLQGTTASDGKRSRQPSLGAVQSQNPSGISQSAQRELLEDTTTILQAQILMYKQLELHIGSMVSESLSAGSSGGGHLGIQNSQSSAAFSELQRGASIKRSESGNDPFGSLPIFASLPGKKQPVGSSRVVAPPNRLSQSILEAHNQKQQQSLLKGPPAALSSKTHNFSFIPGTLQGQDRQIPRLVYLSNLHTYLFDDGSQRITSFRVSDPPKANVERRGKHAAAQFTSNPSTAANPLSNAASTSIKQKGLVHIRGNDLHRDTIIIGVHKARIFLWNKAAELISKFTEEEVVGHKLQWLVDAASIQLITHLYNSGQYRSYCKIKLVTKTGDRAVALKARICKANYMDVDSLGVSSEVYDGSRLIIIGTQIDQTELQPLSYLYSLHMRVLAQYIKSSLGGSVPVHLQEMIDALSWTNLMDRVQNSKHWSAMTSGELSDFLVVPDEANPEDVEIKAIIDSGVAHAFYCDKSELHMTLREILKFAAEAAPSLQGSPSGEYDPDVGSTTSSLYNPASGTSALGGNYPTVTKNRIIVTITQRKYAESYCLQIRVEIPEHKANVIPTAYNGGYSHRPSLAPVGSPARAPEDDEGESMIGGLVLYEDRHIHDLGDTGGNSAPASVVGPPGTVSAKSSRMKKLDTEKYLSIMREAIEKPGSKLRPSRGLLIIGSATDIPNNQTPFGGQTCVADSRPTSAAASRTHGNTINSHAVSGGSVASNNTPPASTYAGSSSSRTQNIVSLFIPISLYRLDAPDLKTEVQKSQAGITFNLYLFIKNPVLHAYFFSQLHDRRHHNIIDCSTYDDLRMALRKAQTDAILIEVDNPTGKAFAKKLVEYQKAEATTGVVNTSVFIVSVATLERTQNDGPQRDGSWLMSSELTEKSWNALAGRLEANKGDREILQIRSRDDYVKGKLVGQGASGYVYEVHDPIRGGTFAMKEIPMTAMSDRKILTKEIETMSQLVHSNIVRYLETKVLDGRMCIYMELCDTSLEALMKRHNSPPILPLLPHNNPAAAQKLLTEALAAAPSSPGGVNRIMPMPFFKIIKYTYQIVKAVLFLHNQEIFHRDIKPANVLLKSDTVKLSDFGSALRDTRRLDIAVLAGEDVDTLLLASTPQGKSSYQAVVGTLRYMAPEVIRFNLYSGACDIWSIGITVLEMLQAMPEKIKLCREMIDFVDLYASSEATSTSASRSRPQSRLDGGAGQGSESVSMYNNSQSDLPFAIPPLFSNLRGLSTASTTLSTAPSPRDGLNDDTLGAGMDFEETSEERKEREMDDAQAAQGIPVDLTPSRIKRLERDIARYGPIALDFITQCLTLHPEKRASASVLLAHPFLAECVDGTLPYLFSDVALPLSMMEGDADNQLLERALYGGGEHGIITDAGLRKKLTEVLSHKKGQHGGNFSAFDDSGSRREKSKSKKDKSKKEKTSTSKNSKKVIDLSHSAVSASTAAGGGGRSGLSSMTTTTTAGTTTNTPSGSPKTIRSSSSNNNTTTTTTTTSDSAGEKMIRQNTNTDTFTSSDRVSSDGSPINALGATVDLMNSGNSGSNPLLDQSATTASPHDADFNASLYNASNASAAGNNDEEVTSALANDEEFDDDDDDGGGFLSVALAPLTNKSTYVSQAEREKINAPSVMNSLRPQVMPPVSMNINDYMGDFVPTPLDGSSSSLGEDGKKSKKSIRKNLKDKQRSSSSSKRKQDRRNAFSSSSSSSMSSGRQSPAPTSDTTDQYHGGNSSIVSDTAPLPSILQLANDSGALSSLSSPSFRRSQPNQNDSASVSQLLEDSTAADTIIVNDDDDTRTYVKRGYDGLLTAVPLTDEVERDVQTSVKRVSRGTSLRDNHKKDQSGNNNKRRKANNRSKSSVVVDPLFAAAGGRKSSANSSSSEEGGGGSPMYMRDVVAVSDSTSCEVSDSSSSSDNDGGRRGGGGFDSSSSHDEAPGQVVDPLFQGLKPKARGTSDSSSSSSGSESASNSSTGSSDSDWGPSSRANQSANDKKTKKRKDLGEIVDPLFVAKPRRDGFDSDSSSSAASHDGNDESSSSDWGESKSSKKQGSSSKKESSAAVVDPLFGGKRATRSEDSSSSAEGGSSSSSSSGGSSSSGSSDSSSEDNEAGSIIDPLFAAKSPANNNNGHRGGTSSSSKQQHQDDDDSDDW